MQWPMGNRLNQLWGGTWSHLPWVWKVSFFLSLLISYAMFVALTVTLLARTILSTLELDFDSAILYITWHPYLTWEYTLSLWIIRYKITKAVNDNIKLHIFPGVSMTVYRFPNFMQSKTVNLNLEIIVTLLYYIFYIPSVSFSLWCLQICFQAVCEESVFFFFLDIFVIYSCESLNFRFTKVLDACKLLVLPP